MNTDEDKDELARTRRLLWRSASLAEGQAMALKNKDERKE